METQTGSAGARERKAADAAPAREFRVVGTRPMSWPGRLKSAPKRARPVTLSTPSGRMVRVPT